MLKQTIISQISIKQRLGNLLDIIAEKVIDIGDFAVYKHTKWTEAILFLYSIFRAVWFVAIGVENANYSYYFGDKVWTTVLVTMSGMHFIGFFMKSMCLRVTAAYMSAIVWGILMCLAIYSMTTAPAVPSLLPLIILSIVVVVRLSHEHKLEAEVND